MNRKTLLAILIGVFSALSKAQNIPYIGHASDQLWSKTAELAIGREAYDQLNRQGRIHLNQADQDYLNYLGQKIAVYSRARVGLTFFLTNAEAINAYATPGGYIGVNAGLVLATDNEHELAGVLAHEIAHVSQEHIARSILSAKNRQVTNAAAIFAGVLVAAAGKSGELGSAAASAVIAGETQSQINDIRRHEIEADSIGRQFMKKAGFNELGMQSFFGKLYTPANAGNIPSYLLTHPLPIYRQAAIDSVKKRSRNLKSSDEYFLFRARLRNALLKTEEINHLISKGRHSKQQQIRGASQYLFALQKMKEGQFSSSLDALEKIHTGMRKKRDVQLLRAKLLLLSGKKQQGQTIYRQLWSQYTGDSIVAYDYALFLEGQGQLRQAEKLLSTQLESSSLNPQLYFLYGRILGHLGERTKQNRMLIRYYEQQGDYKKALSQAKIAAQQAQKDWQSRSMFEAKISYLERILKQLEKD